MKTIANVVLIAALALAPAVKAQQAATAYVFRSVAQPGTIIGGRTFTDQTTISSAVLNDLGEAAFVVTEIGPQPNAVLTSRRIVARQGDLIDGKYISLLRADAAIAINNAGQVAYEAWFADTKEILSSGEASGRGIFVDNHLAFSAPLDSEFPAFTLTDDGKIVMQSPSPSRAPASARVKPDILGRIRIRTPKDLPISIAPSQNRPNRPQQRTAKQIAGERPALAPFPVNHRGQVLVSVNFRSGGFLLLLGTPADR